MTYKVVQSQQPQAKSCYIYFCIHYILTAYVLYPFSPYNTILAITVYISWILNDNYCILSQLEYKYFKKTCWSNKLRPVCTKEKYVLFVSQCIKYFMVYTIKYLIHLPCRRDQNILRPN